MAQLVDVLCYKAEGRSRFLLPMVSMEIFNDIILIMTLVSTRTLTETSTKNISWGGGGIEATSA